MPGHCAPAQAGVAIHPEFSDMATLSSDTRGVQPPSRLGDLLFGGLTRGAAIVTLLLLGGIIVSLAISAWPSIEAFGVRFLWSAEWDPPADVYGALVPIYGTIVTSLIALIIAVLTTGLVMLNVQAFWQFIVVGAVVIIAVLIDQSRDLIVGRNRRGPPT